MGFRFRMLKGLGCRMKGSLTTYRVRVLGLGTQSVEIRDHQEQGLLAQMIPQTKP